MNLLFSPIIGLALLGGGEAMNNAQNATEAEIISRLTELGANVDDEGSELTVYRARTEELIRIAARLSRMTGLGATFNVGEPLLAGPELRHLNGHNNLRSMNITNMPISGEFLDVLPTLPSLQELHCSPKERPAEALVHIGRCKGLRKLSLFATGIADEDCRPLADLENLEQLNLSGNPISSAVRVVKSMKRLKDLSLENTLIDNDGLAAIADLKDLANLFVGSPNVTDVGVAHLAHAENLRSLSVHSNRLTCRGLEKLAALAKLETLYVCETVPDAGLLKALAGLPNLTSLTCSAKGITLEGQIELSALLPNCDIDWDERDDEVANQAAPPGETNELTPAKPRMDEHTPFPTLLANASDFDLCDATFIKIGDHYDHWIDASKYTPEERVVMLVWHSAGIIDNGGFEYLFSGDFDGDPDFRLSAAAFKTIGHEDACVAFDAALKLFPNGQVPQDAEQRIELYKAQPAGARSAINRKFWRARTDGAKSTEKLLAAYIRKNAGAFKTLK